MTDSNGTELTRGEARLGALDDGELEAMFSVLTKALSILHGSSYEDEKAAVDLDTLAHCAGQFADDDWQTLVVQMRSKMRPLN